MSKYTTELRYVCESLIGLDHSAELAQTDAVIEQARTVLFNFDYDIPSLEDRKRLETKIIRHYYFYEINADTVGKFRFYLKSKMNEIMPFYNQLYKSVNLQFNPFEDVNYTEKSTGTGLNTRYENSESNSKTGQTTSDNSTTTGNGTTTTESSGKDSKNGNTKTYTIGETSDKTDTTTTYGKKTTNSGENSGTTNTTGSNNGTRNETTKYSDTPQGTISRLDNDTYLTNATIKNTTDDFHNESKVTTSGTDSSTSTDSGTDKVSVTGSQNTKGGSEVITEESGTNSGNSTQTTENNGTTESSGTLNSDNMTTVNSVNMDTSSDNYFKTVKGKMSGASYAELLTQYRDTLLNIDNMVIADLSELFMFVF